MNNQQHIAFEVARDEHYKSSFLKSLKENWPALAKDYRHYCHLHNPAQGDVWVWTSPEGQKFFHLILEEEVDQKLADSEKLHYLRQALRKMKKMASDEKIEQVSFPTQAFHLKGDKAELQKIVDEVLADSQVQVLMN